MHTITQSWFNSKSKSQDALDTLIEQFIAQYQPGDSLDDDDVAFVSRYSGRGQGGKADQIDANALLYEFYTPVSVAKLMWQLAVAHGYDGGPVLEPSAATGNVLVPFSQHTTVDKLTAVELNPITAAITKIRIPGVTMHEGFFETLFLEPTRFRTTYPEKRVTWINGYPFSLVIGNPPYGIYKNHYSSYFTKPKLQQIEFFFFYHGLRLCKPGGLVIYLTASNFLRRSGERYLRAKEHIFSLGELVDAYRMPDTMFARSKVPTDIIILKRK
jgi:type I restriction-modification system DNA methylase subunit